MIIRTETYGYSPHTPGLSEARMEGWVAGKRFRLIEWLGRIEPGSAIGQWAPRTLRRIALDAVLQDLELDDRMRQLLPMAQYAPAPWLARMGPSTARPLGVYGSEAPWKVPWPKSPEYQRTFLGIEEPEE